MNKGEWQWYLLVNRYEKEVKNTLKILQKARQYWKNIKNKLKRKPRQYKYWTGLLV